MLIWMYVYTRIDVVCNKRRGQLGGCVDCGYADTRLQVPVVSFAFRIPPSGLR